MEDGNFVDRLEDSFLDIADGAADFVPKLLVALLLVIIGMILARYISHWIGKLVDYVEKSKQVKSTTESLGIREVDIDGVVAVFVRWTIMLIFFSAAVDVLGLPVLTDTFNALVGFVPNILAAVVVAALSFVAANAVHDIVDQSAKKSNVKVHSFLAKASKVAVLVFGLPLAVAQLGLDLTIVTNNITVVVGGIMLAFGLAFGLGGKDVAGKILDDLYKNWKR